MNAAEIALAGSLLVNVMLAWKLIDASYRAAMLRHDVDYWRDSALHWSKSFDDLRRNSVKRNPKTGRYIKDYTK